MKKKVTIIGCGPAAMMLAAQLNPERFEVTIYERNFAPARKFLVAGDGGFNLTHADPPEELVLKYTPVHFFKPIIATFTNADLIKWLAAIGIPTFTGSSKRIFPLKPIKPIEVLTAILKLLKARQVVIKNNMTWQGWYHDKLIFNTKSNTPVRIDSTIVVFALGGSSWQKTGSDGTWLNHFIQKGIATVPFSASNCAVQINWPDAILKQLQGKALKNISIACSDKQIKGEIVVTAFGLEGGAIYALSPQIRAQLQQNKTATILLDLKPALTSTEINKRLTGKPGRKSWTKHLHDELNLNDEQLLLLKSFSSKDEYLSAATISAKIKKLPLQITAMAPIDEAISTVGGIALHEVDEHLQLKKLPGNYAIGEMLDWDAPTGGYLLQACFSMGYALAQHLNKQEV